MKPFKKILVAHDFSEHAAAALETAVDLSRRYEASLTILYVQEPISYATPEAFPVYPWNQITVLLEAGEKQLEKAKQQALELGATAVEARLAQGSPSFEITKHAKSGGYDLIVMGTHGRTGIARALMGSVAERVVRTAPCSVATVRLPVEAA